MKCGVLPHLDGVRKAGLMFVSQYSAVSKVGSCKYILTYSMEQSPS
jgi:hypothetical protein